MRLSMAARRKVSQAQLAKWSNATKAEKSAILDAVCQETGWHRDDARKAIRGALAEQVRSGRPVRVAREVVRTYDDDAVAHLRQSRVQPIAGRAVQDRPAAGSADTRPGAMLKPRNFGRPLTSLV